MREEFEKWTKAEGYNVNRHVTSGDYTHSNTYSAFIGWQARQPEIDALESVIDDLALQKGMLKAEIGRLTDEVESLKKALEGK